MSRPKVITEQISNTDWYHVGDDRIDEQYAVYVHKRLIVDVPQ